MTNFAIAMLAGLLLALLLATAQQKWSCKVFFLLALRLAIGWHFLFEGMHKIHSHWMGPMENNVPFSSEPYFNASPTPIGDYFYRLYEHPHVAKYFESTQKITREHFLSLSPQRQAELCPAGLRKELLELAESENPPEPIEKVTPLMIQYARWLHGVDTRDTKLDRISGSVPLSVPQRREHIDAIQHQVRALQTQQQTGIGSGNADLPKRIAAIRTELRKAETSLCNDAAEFVDELKFHISPRKQSFEKQATRGEKLDFITRWFLAAVGGCLLLGFCTRLSCVLAAGFLVMTYIIHPPFPWYPLPPNTEGNPVFINKNVIECLALLAIACFPTGKWLGIDALLCRCCCWRRKASTT